MIRSSHPWMFLGKGILKIFNKFTGEYPCRSAISIKLLCNFTEITHRHGCSPINLLHIFRTPFPRNTSDGLFLDDDPLFKTLHALREKCPYSELFWPVFYCICSEYREILCISPYSVRMRKNTDRNNPEYRLFSRSVEL